MVTVENQVSQKRKRNKINPKKFGLWIAIMSMIMMFAGFTSGYIVRRAQGNWLVFDLPTELYISTVVVLLSSLTIWLASRAFKNGKISSYKNMLTITMILGLLFATLQYFGFKDLFSQISWNNNVSLQYLLVIVGIHALHILGGVVALLAMVIKLIIKKKPNPNGVGIELMSTYWHFVDILWIYLFIFFMLSR